MVATFSVVIPTWNRQTTVSRAIESVLAQSYPHFELLIVDDGSTDASLQQLSTYTQDKRVRILTQNHKGVSAARNRGIAEASAEYIAFLDSDDLWLADKLEKQYDYLSTYSQYDLVQTNEIWLRNGIRVNPKMVHKKQQGDLFHASLLRCAITPSSIVIRKTLLEQTGVFDERLAACEDYDLWLRISCQHRVGLIEDTCLIRYGGHQDQLSHSFPAMDRFRIFAIHKLLTETKLNQEQQQQAEQVLTQKVQLLLTGAYKRKSLHTTHIPILEKLAQHWSDIRVDTNAEILLNQNNWQE